MPIQATTRRSVYADRLLEFSDFAFGDEAAFGHQGHWREFFQKRMGTVYGGGIILDIGCFDAAFLGRIAGKHPETAFIGLDWKCKPLYDGACRIAELGLRNVALVRGRGQDLRRIFGDGEVNEIWLFHPDPCDREVERKNRLMGKSFLLDAHGVLRDASSVLALKTDHRDYYQSALAAVEAIGPRFAVTANTTDYWHDAAAIAHTSDRFFSGEVTLFESRFIRRRQPIYYFELRRRA